MDFKEDLIKDLEFVLGPCGRNLSVKRRYNPYKANLILHNIYLCSPLFGVLWEGDIDVSVDEKKLKKIAQKYNLEFWLIMELDIKLNPFNPHYENSQVKITKTKTYLHDRLSLNCRRNLKGKFEVIYDLSYFKSRRRDSSH